MIRASGKERGLRPVPFIPGARRPRAIGFTPGTPGSTRSAPCPVREREDDAEDRLDGLFTQGVGRPACGGLEPAGHPLYWGRIGWQGRRVSEALRPIGMVFVALDRDRRLRAGRFAGGDVSLAEVAGVGRQLRGLGKVFGQRCEMRQQRLLSWFDRSGLIEPIGEPQHPPPVIPARPGAAQSCSARVPAQAVHCSAVHRSVAAHSPAWEFLSQRQPDFEFDQRIAWKTPSPADEGPAAPGSRPSAMPGIVAPTSGNARSRSTRHPSAPPLRVHRQVCPREPPFLSHTWPLRAAWISFFEGIRLAVDPDEFAMAIASVHEDAELWERISRAGLVTVSERLTTTANRPRLQRLLRDVGQPAGDSSMRGCHTPCR